VEHPTLVPTEEAFYSLIADHVPALFRFGRRLTGSVSEAEDLVQETLVRALEKRGMLRDAEKLKPWLMAVERSIWLNSRRRPTARFEVLDGGFAGDVRTEPTGDLEREILRRTLSEACLAALDALPREWRETLWLREVEEFSYEEIAQIVGCPVGTVRSRLARARSAMLTKLRPEEASDGL
jgi:RNA polymerase sigma-70 factor (ECF subfamily)